MWLSGTRWGWWGVALNGHDMFFRNDEILWNLIVVMAAQHCGCISWYWLVPYKIVNFFFFLKRDLPHQPRLLFPSDPVSGPLQWASLPALFPLLPANSSPHSQRARVRMHTGLFPAPARKPTRLEFIPSPFIWYSRSGSCEPHWVCPFCAHSDPVDSDLSRAGCIPAGKSPPRPFPTSLCKPATLLNSSPWHPPYLLQALIIIIICNF